MEKRREFYKATAIFEVNGVSNKIDLGLRYGVIPENYSSTITDFDTFLKRAEELGYKVKTEVSLFRNKQKKIAYIGWDKITDKNFKSARKTVIYTKTNPTCSYCELGKTLPYYQMVQFLKDSQYPNRYLKG